MADQEKHQADEETDADGDVPANMRNGPAGANDGTGNNAANRNSKIYVEASRTIKRESGEGEEIFVQGAVRELERAWIEELDPNARSKKEADEQPGSGPCQKIRLAFAQIDVEKKGREQKSANALSEYNAGVTIQRYAP